MSLQNFASWTSIIGVTLLGIYFCGFLVYHTMRRTSSDGSWFIGILERHFAVTIGLPLAAISSMCVVIVLGVTTGGNLEFSVLGFTFTGVSGPVTLWLICFLAMVFGMKLLWKERSDAENQAGASNGQTKKEAAVVEQNREG